MTRSRYPHRSPGAAPAQRESDWDRTVLDIAASYGWPLAYHTHDSRRSEEGFPDRIFLRPGRGVALELKGAKTRVTPAQLAWVAAFDTVPGFDAAIVRPRDLQLVADLLGPRRAA